jgi:hypothetical protein
MPWEVFNRDDVMQGRDVPFIGIGPQHISFNAVFGRSAELQPGKLVTIYVDSENLKIGFDFHGEKGSNSFLLTQSSGKKNSFTCSSHGLVQKYPWIQSVSHLGAHNRRFTPSKEGKLWVIQLCPAFEERRARESADKIPSDVRGVYRYVRESGEIVYIGRGEVKKRFSQPERQNWDFDRIEYSLVADPDQQVKWEDYWITRFKQSNKGRLPIYNKVSGASCDDDGAGEDS